MNDEARETPAPAGRDGEAAGRWRGYAAAALACGAATLASAALFAHLDAANIVMIYLLSVVVVAFRWGRGPGALATALGVLSFDFFFVPPRFSIEISDLQYLLTFAVMLAVGMTIGHLAAGLRREARAASQRESRSLALYAFARDLSGALEAGQVARLAQDSIARAFGCATTLLIVDDAAAVGLHAPAPDGAAFDAEAARDAIRRPGSAARAASVDGNVYLPLSTSARTRGVLVLAGLRGGFAADAERRRTLETWGTLVATALERVHYVEVAQQATLRVESERLRNSLLSALSHDLRTPLTAVFGLADTLARTRPPLPAAQHEIVASILDETQRMNALVDNLLDMARIESGPIRLDLQWQPIDEVIGSALRAARWALARHAVRVEVAPGLPLVAFDAVLIERVLCNLLENAAKHTPPGTTVTVSARLAGEWLAVEVADDGPGLPSGRSDALFEKFTRGTPAPPTGGVGLGLAVCRALVEAHGGRIGARPRPGGGAIFGFTLPVGTPPCMPVLGEEPDPLDRGT